MTLRDGLRAAAGRLVPRRMVNALLRWARITVGPARFDAMMGRGHRLAGYRLLAGQGVEIGALHAPAPLPAACKVTYVDAMSTEEARKLFPEVDAKRLVRVDVVTDLDKQGLGAIADASVDFAVMNHVIEHVANPVRVVEELFRIVRPGGHVVISAPDMRFSFDRGRALTSDDHLLAEYCEGVDQVTDSHYEEFARAMSPDALAPAKLALEVKRARDRREHAHVWNSESFARFLQRAMDAARVDAELLTVSGGDDNRLEHYSVWRRSDGSAKASPSPR